MSSRVGILYRAVVLLAFVVASMASSASRFEVDIKVDKAVGSPTLTISYHGAAAAIAELRINGDSYGTRNLDSSKTSGETSFTVNTAMLLSGDNSVEVRLYDKDGALLGSKQTKMVIDDIKPSVFVSAPKTGATVQGPVSIKVGFGQSLRNPYVSFFVDDQFKAMTNLEPFDYTWDSTLAANGWHDLEAWAVDDGSLTYKTPKIRIFVNNPSGHTDRRVILTAPGLATPATRIAAPSPVKVVPAVVAARAALALRYLANTIVVELAGAPAALKQIDIADAVPTGGRLMTPTGTREAIANGLNAQPSGAATVKTSATPNARAVSQTPSAREPGAPLVESPAPLSPQPAPAKDATTVALTPEAKAANTAPVATEPITRVVTITPVRPSVTAAVAPAKSVSVALPRATLVATAPKAPAARLVAVSKGFRLPVASPFKVEINSEIADFDVQPRVDAGVPIAPIRYLIEHLGGTVDWSNESKTVHAVAGGQDILLTIGAKVAKVNHLDVELELAPRIVKGRTLAPITFLHDALMVNVEYDRTTGHVLITKE